MKTDKECFEELTKNSKGWAIENWEYRSEGFSLTISKGDEKKILHVIATDLGMELDKISVIAHNGDELSTDLFNLAHEIADHLADNHEIYDEEEIPKFIEIIGNSRWLQYNFICKECGEKWSIALRDVKNSPNRKMVEAMKSPETMSQIFSWECLYDGDNGIQFPTEMLELDLLEGIDDDRELSQEEIAKALAEMDNVDEMSQEEINKELREAVEEIGKRIFPDQK